jgi:sugar phosphate isomerase/epimerase
MEIGMSLGPDDELIEKIQDLPEEEIDFIEFGIGERERNPEEFDNGEVREVLDEKNFGIVIHLPFRQPLATEVDELNQGYLKYQNRLMNTASDLGAKKVVVHADLRKQGREEEEEKLTGQIKKMMELGQENNLEVCFENMGQWRGLELLELGELLDELDASMCFDTGHAFSEVGQEETEEFLDEYSHLISHLHLTDTREGRDMHLPIGSEEVGFKAIGEKLSDFDGTATMEIFTEDNDYILLSKKKVEEFWQRD